MKTRTLVALLALLVVAALAAGPCRPEPEPERAEAARG
jgi:hypothetical protein